MSVEFVGKSLSGIETYAIDNGNNGMSARIITYGARIQNLFVKNKYGDSLDVVAGFDDPEEFRNDRGTYFNAIIGRVGNRIGGAAFSLNGKRYELFKNDGNNHLHGGRIDFSKRIWTADIVGETSLKLSYLSKDGEEGYPGNLKVDVIYSLTENNALRIEYEAVSDADTLCSLTNHAYFNLEGDFKTALRHEIFINADHLTDVDNELIPNGKLMEVKGTPFDFTTPKLLGRDISADERLLKTARGGYDFNYVLKGGGPAAWAYSTLSGIKMSVYTDRPCMQFYTGNFLDGFKGKTSYPYQSAFCMETQGYPNACNLKEFDGMTLKAGDVYRTATEYLFTVE